ncbi:MAG: XRE family transcriptional regulator [Alphaproteobacteria bacterium]|nr:MAG: XRE family transcriptional regulator [Alphaproteobacteria bacterium]
MSQEKLGEAVNLTFQQIQKYERGANRIGSSRLFQLAQVLGVPVSYFFDEMPQQIDGVTRGLAQPAQEHYDGEDQMSRRETLELIRAYYRILNPQVRKRVFDLVKAIGQADNEMDD